MRIFLTGATGFLGGRLLRALVRAGHRVRLLHRAESDLSGLPAVPHERVRGDVADAASLAGALAGCDAVIHAAALVSFAAADRGRMETVNVSGTAGMVAAARAQGVRRFVFTSSIAAVGASERPEALTEDAPFPDGLRSVAYCDTKRRAEALVLAAAAPGFETIALNPVVIFGARPPGERSGRIIVGSARGTLRFVPGGGVSVVDVDDVVQAHLAALERGEPGTRYILGGENLHFVDLVTRLARAADRTLVPRRVPAPVTRAAGAWIERAAALFGFDPPLTDATARLSTLFAWADSARAARDLDYRPLGFDETAARTIAAYRERGWL